MMKSKLTGGPYRPLGRINFVVERNLAEIGLPKILRMMRSLSGEWKVWARECGLRVKFEDCIWLHRLQCTVPGDVSLRLIHSSAGNTLSGVAAFLEVFLGPVAVRNRHLERDSRELVQRLRTVEELVSSTQFTKLDFKGIYSSGEHEEIVKAVAEIISCQEQRSIVARALE
jgi:hypothetical protein